MEKIRRAITIFWVEHGTPILFWTIVVVAIILIVQGLNALAIKKQEQESKITDKTSNTMQPISAEENSDNIELINTFIDYCKKEQLEEAYSLLSEKCKKDLYPTLVDFTNKYYKKVFNQKRNTEIKYDSSKGIYRIMFYEDILESGKIENRENIEDHYEVEQEVIEKRCI